MKNEDERRKIFDEVWEKPITTLARKYGISDSALRKRCIRLEIPLPPKGHWEKVKSGKEVSIKPELPSLEIDNRQEKEITLQQQETVELRVDLDNGDKEFKKWCNKIKVCKKVNFYNPLISEYQNEIDYRKKRDEEHRFHEAFRYSYDLNFQRSQSKVPYRNNKVVLPIDVSDIQLNRALRIMETIIRYINELGGQVMVCNGDEDNATLAVFKTSFSFKLKEIKNKYRSILGQSDARKSIKPMYEKVPTGFFEIEIAEILSRKGSNTLPNVLKFTESADRPMEDQIGNIFILIREISEVLKQKLRIEEKEQQLKLAEARREQEIRKEIKRREEEIEERKHRKLALIESIDQQMNEWFNVQKMKKYIRELEDYVSTRVDNEEKELLAIYINLIKRKAAIKNPIDKIIDDIRFIGKEGFIEDESSEY